MGKLMSLLSVLTGSSPATIHNARAEISNKYGNGVMSNSEERRFIFERFAKDIPAIVGIEASGKMPPGAAIGYMLDKYTQTFQSDDVKFSQIFSRVMVHYYDYETDNVETLMQALTRMGLDFDLYLENKNLF